MIDQKRGKNVVISGAAGQLVFVAAVLVIWLWTNSLSALSCSLLLAGGVPLWLMAALLFYCRQLARQEADELQELASQGATTGTIFEGKEGEQLRPAADRSAFVERWVVPVFTLLWAGFHVAIGLLMLRYLRGQAAREIENAAQGILLVLVIGFPAFLFSRYATGMSKGPQWRLLRPAGSYLLLNVLLMAALLGALIGARQGNMEIDLVVAYAPPIIQLMLAVELLLNFVLDLYRPRIPGQEHRPSFDSRLLNLVAEPGRVGHSIAEALNYQFGFEVSKTWFYQLLSRAFVPLLLFAGLVLVAMSSLVVVGEGEKYVVLHWGRAQRTFEPGLHLKWPWPIDTARRFETGKVHELLLGAGEERTPVIIKGREVYLWSQEHGARKELDFLLAVPPRAGEAALQGTKKPPPPVNIIKLVVAVQYVIDDPYRFGYRYTDSAKVLECIASREMSRYCASATLDSPVPGGVVDRPEAIMTYGRERAAAELKKRIQQGVDEAGLGVAIRYVGLVTVHPPAEAAPAYEAVPEAERRMMLTRYEAEGEAKKILAQVAGSPMAALKLALAIQTLEDLEKLRDRPAETDKILAEQVRQAEDNIQVLQKEIEQERLLGLAPEGEGKTTKQQLLEAYKEYQKLFEKIRLPGAVDLDREISLARQETDDLLRQTVGEPARVIAEAEGYQRAQELTEAARAEAFQRELLAYQASPNMYITDRWLDVWDEVLPDMTKYVLGVDREKIEIWLNWESQADVLEDVTFAKEGAK